MQSLPHRVELVFHLVHRQVFVKLYHGQRCIFDMVGQALVGKPELIPGLCCFSTIQI